MALIDTADMASACGDGGDQRRSVSSVVITARGGDNTPQRPRWPAEGGGRGLG